MAWLFLFGSFITLGVFALAVLRLPPYLARRYAACKGWYIACVSVCLVLLPLTVIVIPAFLYACSLPESALRCGVLSDSFQVCSRVEYLQFVIGMSLLFPGVPLYFVSIPICVLSAVRAWQSRSVGVA